MTTSERDAVLNEVLAAIHGRTSGVEIFDVIRSMRSNPASPIKVQLMSAYGSTRVTLHGQDIHVAGSNDVFALRRALAKAVEDEREECAKVANNAAYYNNPVACSIANRIRERGTTGNS